MAIVHITTQKEFDKEVAKAKGPVVVDFWAPWCGPCKMVAPVFEEMSKKYTKVKFAKIDVDEAEPEISQRFNIMSIPTIIFFKNSKVADQRLGALTRGQFEEFIENNLDKEK